jgi:hypothetical protein
MRKEGKGCAEEEGKKNFVAIAVKKRCPIVITVHAVFKFAMPAFRKTSGASATALRGFAQTVAGYE